jgi:uncharacterized membrane protein YeaQ/YmgE (transglycosylase-associated protein family)
MGLLVWLSVGMLLAVIGKALARWDLTGPVSLGPPSLLAAVGGAVLGGFLVDMTVRGDSVTHLNPVTVVGAVVGTLLVLILAELLRSRPETTDRRHA